MVFGRGSKKPEMELPIEPTTVREQALLRQQQLLHIRLKAQEDRIKNMEKEQAGAEEGKIKHVVSSIKERFGGGDEFCDIKASHIARGEPEGAAFPVGQPHLLLTSLGFNPSLEMAPQQKLDVKAIIGEPHAVPIHKFDGQGRPTDEIIPLFPNMRSPFYRIIWEPAPTWGKFGGVAYDEGDKILRIPIPLGETKAWGRRPIKHRLYGAAFPRVESIIGSNALLKSIGVSAYDLMLMGLDHDTVSYLLKESLELERALRHLGMRRIRQWEARSEDMFKMMQRFFLAQAFMGHTKGTPSLTALEGGGGEFAFNRALEMSKFAQGETGGKTTALSPME